MTIWNINFNTTGTGGAKHINVIIPLNRFSFFEQLENKMLVPMQLQFNVSFNEDKELIHMANGTDAGRVVIHKFELWLPKMIPKDSLYSRFVRELIYEGIKVEYLREMYEVSAPTRTSGFFQISASIVFVNLKKNYREETSPYKMNTLKYHRG